MLEKLIGNSLEKLFLKCIENGLRSRRVVEVTRQYGWGNDKLFQLHVEMS